MIDFANGDKNTIASNGLSFDETHNRIIVRFLYLFGFLQICLGWVVPALATKEVTKQIDKAGETVTTNIELHKKGDQLGTQNRAFHVDSSGVLNFG